MILHGIKARNFMSLRDCTIDDLDDHLNFLVGPNGSGKTTVFRALKAVRDTFSFDKPAPFDQLCSRGVNPKEVDLTLDVEFNTSWEQELITAFLCASLSRPNELSQILRQVIPQFQTPIASEGDTAFSEWLLRSFRPKSLSFLFRGKLQISYRSQNYDHLRITYTFDHNSTPITFLIRPFDGVLVRGNLPNTISGGYSPMNAFVEYVQSTGSLQDVVTLLTRQSNPAEPSFDPIACFLYLSEKRVTLGIDTTNAQQVYLPALRRFAELSGILSMLSSSNRSYQFSYILQTLLNHALVFTNNLRVPIDDIASFSIQAVAKPEVDLDNEREIPLLLYRLKNGDFSQRKRFERIQKSFSELIGENLGFDIHAGFENAQQSELAVDIRVTDQEDEIPLAYHGAGVWEALMLSTILDESEGRVILLDEPASNLHAGRQHKLLEILHAVLGQVIVVTHSADMLPTIAEDFRKVRRMRRTSSGTLVKGLDSSSWIKLDKLEKELNKSGDLAGLLIRDGVILVEGETETAALKEWFPKSTVSRGKTFADLNLALYWVGGKTNFPFYMHFLSELGIPWVGICDGDAIPSNENRPVWNALKDLNLIDNVPATVTFEEAKAFAEKAGLYTANCSCTEKFEDIAEVKSYKDSNTVPGDGKVQQARYIAEHIPCPEEIDKLLQLALRRLGKYK